MIRLSRFLSMVAKLLNRLQFASTEDCTLAEGVRLGPRGVFQSMTAGKNTIFGHDCTAVHADVGAYCSIASYSVLGGGEHPIYSLSTSPSMFTADQKKRYQAATAFPKVTIGNDVWIGEACFVKCGVTIGTGAVIGAHSVVTKDIPPYTIAVGAPARVIRNRFDEETTALLLQSRWWDWSKEEIAEYLRYAERSEDFAAYLKKESGVNI